jgi:hypothetical protein
MEGGNKIEILDEFGTRKKGSNRMKVLLAQAIF